MIDNNATYFTDVDISMSDATCAIYGGHVESVTITISNVASWTQSAKAPNQLPILPDKNA